MEDYQRLVNGQVIIMRFMAYFVISFKENIKIYKNNCRKLENIDKQNIK